MLRQKFLLLLPFLARINGGNAAAQTLRFLYPDRDDLDFLPGDVVNLSYETNFTAPYLITWCRPGNASRLGDTIRIPGGNNSFPVTLSSTEYGDTRCWFDIEESEDRQGLNKNSPAFNYVNDTRSSGPTTFGLSSTFTPATTTLATAISTPASGSTTTSTTTTLPTTSSEPPGLSTGAVAGIGIGAAVAGVVLVAIIAVPVLVLRWRKKKQGRGQDLSQKTRHYKQISSIAAVSDTHELSAPHEGRDDKQSIALTLQPQEMDAVQTQRYEAQ